MPELSWGRRSAVPDDAPTAWGARWIFPADHVWDRQDFYNMDTAEGRQLKAWLDGGAIKQAMIEATRLAGTWDMSPTSQAEFVLFEDNYGRFVGSPQGSAGYLYVAAWPKGAV